MRWKLPRILAALSVGSASVLLAMTGASATTSSDSTDPPPSTWAGTISVAAKNQYSSASDGDLWPSCWAADGSVHAAWGDGHGFDPNSPFVDVGTARIDGDAASLTGVNTATADGVSQVWNPPNHTRKPTGMVCVGNTLYLAVQDLSTNFSEVPAATIVKSTDGGKTWTWNKQKPMFDNHVFTTIWFADFGRGGEWNTSRYVYAYGLDGNWRDSPPPFNDVPDPQDMFLARVPKDKIQDRNSWQFFSGYAKNGTPKWNSNISAKQAVLHDARRDYPQTFSDNSDGIGSSVLGQGGVTYDKPLNRYIYAGWSEWVMHFYESPTPWGPWTLMGDKDFTSADNRTVQYSGYGTSFPSKFLSADGKTLMLQSNRCCGGSTGYQFSLRPVTLQLHSDTVTDPTPGPENLATDPTTVPISKSVRQGSLAALNNGDSTDSIDDSDGEVKQTDWWGYTWPAPKTVNEVTFTTGTPQADGGWFITRPKIQYRHDGEWTDVPVQGYVQPFVTGAAGGDHATYTVQFPAVTGDGIRVVGIPGGDRTYSSMSEISVHHRNALVVDGGFENTTGYGPVWNVDGDAPHGIDTGCCARTGTHNAWIRTQSALGKQFVYQTVEVTPGTKVDLSAWVRTSDVVKSVFIGARWSGGSDIATVASVNGDYQNYQHSVTVPAGVHSIDVMVGYSADGGDAIFQLDDVSATSS
ncbi:MAG TPA: hypothetical protein VHC49_21100 [Mycobacteriales bacterium]|nr:hypothetical protein [Mycobacteriales bacterium]